MLVLVDSLAVILVVLVAIAIAIAVGVAGRRAGLGRASRTHARTTLLGIGGLLGVQAIAATSGVLAEFDARPPRMMVLVLVSVVTFSLVTRTASFDRLLDAMPLSWPIGIQAMRVPIELGLWSLALAGRLPLHLTFEGRNFDVLVGLTAPFVALGVARGWIGARGAIAWNVVSLALLFNIVAMAVTSVPGPLHLDWPGPPNTVVAELPYVWLPGFLVPVALFGHVASLRQLARLSRGARTRATVAVR